MTLASGATALLARALRGDRARWADFRESPEAVLELCVKHGVAGLLHEAVNKGLCDDWPGSLTEALAGVSRRAAAEELLRQRELARVLQALNDSSVAAILMKGTPLAYSLYASPSLRERCDTDLLIRDGDALAAQTALERLGYARPPSSSGRILFRQFSAEYEDPLGVGHVLDVHCAFSCRKLFAKMLSFEELWESREPVPALGPHAFAPSAPHSLLIAAVHPVMHHHGDDRLIWREDVRLLCESLDDEEFEIFAELAEAKGVRAICAWSLGETRKLLGAAVPSRIEERLARGQPEPSAAFLDSKRRWHQDQLSDFAELGSWRERLVLAGEIAFPPPAAILKSYRLGGTPAAKLILPALYVHRALRGIVRVFTGAK